MDLGDQFETEHLYLTERTCKICGETKDLIDGFYKTRKTRSDENAYSYECKECTKKRVANTRKAVVNKMTTNIFGRWEYPDW